MEPITLVGILGGGLLLGALHAFDADHVLAVSALGAEHDRGARGYSLRWALGHGGAVLAAGLCVLGLGTAVPTGLSGAAEALVGLVLVGLGLQVLLRLRAERRRATHGHAHWHMHDGLPPHPHWHTHAPALHRQNADTGSHAHHHHRAVMVGVLHGTAGSAPLLALLPASQLGSPAWGLAYLLLFCLGVVAGMGAFGGLLGGALRGLARRDRRLAHGLRAALAGASLSFGVYLLAMLV